MLEEFCCGVSLEDFLFGTSTNTWNSQSIDEQVFNPNIIDKDLECTFLGFGLINYHDIKGYW